MPVAQSEINSEFFSSFFQYQIKCSQYWPESTNEEYYGDINISKCEERHFAFYVIRKFTMWNSEVKKNINSKNQNTIFYNKFNIIFFSDFN